ncbi:hypothetical protein, partial [Streptomyces clavuligerus]
RWTVNEPPPNPRHFGYLARNPIGFPPCHCPEPRCTLKRPLPEPTDSPVFADLRGRVQEDIERRHRFGNFGR